MGYTVSFCVNPTDLTPVLLKHGTAKASARAAIIHALGLDPDAFMNPTPRSMRCQPTSVLVPVSLRQSLISQAYDQNSSITAVVIAIMNSWLDHGGLLYDGQYQSKSNQPSKSICLYLPHDLLAKIKESGEKYHLTLASTIRTVLRHQVKP